MYRLGQYVGYGTLRDTLMNAVAAPFRRIRSAGGDGRKEAPEPDSQYIWALRNVSLEVRKGEVVGIIGRNGAGKTTLLKILSRITNPTEGYAEIRGRVGSLLEVGTGFHPELTGQENIYLNGAVLGMKKKEIDRKFDEIVDFSGVEKFIDTPLKRYSTGMQVRLAFAVAAHLEPEVLLVDEVLAVGDVAFQQKCLGKMDDLSQEGRTVLFVSHDMTRIGKLCPRSVLLDEGGVSYQGETSTAISKYLQSADRTTLPEVILPSDQSKVMCLRSIRILDSERNPSTVVDGSKSFFMETGYEIHQRVVGAYVAVTLSTADELTRVWTTRDTAGMSGENADRDPGTYAGTVEFPGGVLNSGKYYARVALSMAGMAPFDRHNSPTFEVVNSDIAEFLAASKPGRRGILALPLKWTMERGGMRSNGDQEEHNGAST